MRALYQIIGEIVSATIAMDKGYTSHRGTQIAAGRELETTIRIIIREELQNIAIRTYRKLQEGDPNETINS